MYRNRMIYILLFLFSIVLLVFYGVKFISKGYCDEFNVNVNLSEYLVDSNKVNYTKEQLFNVCIDGCYKIWLVDFNVSDDICNCMEGLYCKECVEDCYLVFLKGETKQREVKNSCFISCL